MDETVESLVRQGVRAVVLATVDTANITRVKCVPIAALLDAAESGVGLSPVFTVSLVNDAFTESAHVGGPTGDLRLVPDLEMTTAMAAMPGWAWAPVDQRTQDGAPWAGCSRAFVRSMTERLAERGLEVRAAFEHEFFMGRRAQVAAMGESHVRPWPAHEGPGYSAEALTKNAGFALDLIEAMTSQGIGLQQFHPEYGQGQFEVSVAPRDPVSAADVAVITRQTIRAVGRSHGNDISFAPVVVPDSVGNGTHVHFSLWDMKGRRNLFAGGEHPHGMTSKAASFAAGVLRELPALTCVVAPSVPSYSRLQPHRWAGAYTAWGLENREAALRFVAARPGTDGSSANMELKVVDGSANPYLALGALIAVGLAGVEDGLELPEGTVEDPDSLSEHVKRARGIERLPRSLAEAASALETSEVLRKAMGDVLFEAFLASRKAEHALYGDCDLSDIVHEHLWRY